MGYITLSVRFLPFREVTSTSVLAQAPSLHVPGMTEFSIDAAVIVGLMPERGIARLLGLGGGSTSWPEADSR